MVGLPHITTFVNGHMTLRLRAPHPIGYYAVNVGSIRHCHGDKTFLICHVIPKDHMFKRLCDFMSRIFSPPCHVSHQRPCGKRDIMYLICHVTLCGHVFRGLCDYICGSPL